jgi:hypothetical protein
MKTHIEHIIDELCELDPKLEKKRPELQKMIAEILKTKPDTKFDGAFKKKLYRQLMEKASGTEKNSSFFHFLFMKPLPSLFSGLVMGAVAMFATTQYLPLYTQQIAITPTTDVAQESLVATYGQRDLLINSRGPGAFGGLNSVATGIRNQSGGGGGGVSNPAPIADSKMMIAPEGPFTPPTQYQYNYTGELTLPTEPIEVLKRVRGKELLQNLPAGIQQIAANLIDLSLFKNAKLNSLDILEDSPDGFTININFSEGIVGLFKQYEYKPYVEGQQPPTYTLPSDETLFSISNDFLNKYRVNLESYGTPEINKFWIQYPENQIPQQITVVYPLMINGKTVYDQGGTKYGINVNIDLGENEVYSVWNIRNNQYDSSTYPAVAETERVLAMAKKGGMFHDWYYGEEQKDPVNLELGAPEEAYLNFSKFDETTGQSDEILVPALIFPVVSDHKDSMYPPRQTVVVPLAKEILEEMEKQSPIMPFVR